ncbi:DsbE family thiol:disulfide interchange protein [Inmirania thermothiophila]|uniref:Cytochrome c biogenesis protein CcmG/thiol:disulfide interchange protein DsbE n=1 Tax=Inmirania thermothiophila TaxID=1750597 RepID=A0A3N1Y7H8_9GAMM|nr:DsbE family thiol:disulfide interchange protein [Inmirania thermothiophila]ROR34779.1 cytochrome c biogenesis protein CcmG/thiol:disulfide interchange protein DsbE [Inmirania thermothiophila]
MRARYYVPLLIFLPLTVVFAVGLFRDPKLVPSPLIDKPAPEFRLPELREPQREVTRDDLLGRVSLVNVWASWCTACRQEHPLLMELGRAKVVQIVGLNYKDERENALAWLAELGDPYDLVAQDRSGRVGIDWGVYGVPETFLVDARGVIRYKHIGPMTPRVIEEEILPRVRALQAAGGAS